MLYIKKRDATFSLVVLGHYGNPGLLVLQHAALEYKPEPEAVPVALNVEAMALSKEIATHDHVQDIVQSTGINVVQQTLETVVLDVDPEHVHASQIAMGRLELYH